MSPTPHVGLIIYIYISIMNMGYVWLQAKKSILTFVAVVFGLTIYAQEASDTMYIYRTNGIERIAVSDIDSITFVAPDNSAPATSHQAIDLGLPSGVKWASCNIGATTPEEYGAYYAWGEIEEKDDYTAATNLYYQKNIGDDISATSYDVARHEWGGKWRLPTKTEQEELCSECSWEWATLNGVNGYRITGPNGNSIFLPAAGYRYGMYTFYEGECGFYWSSTIYCSLNSYYMYYDNSYHGMYYYARYDGLTVRPVTD